MNKDILKSIASNYCTRANCVTCPIKKKPWKHELDDCLDIGHADEDELIKAIELFRENEPVEKANEPEEKGSNDPVNKPAHYTDGKIEVIEFIEDKKLGFCLGNAVKYIARAGKKDPAKEIEDLKKADWYIKRRIRELEEAN